MGRDRPPSPATVDDQAADLADVTLGTRTLRSSLWNLVAFALNKGALLVTTVVVTRLLTTEEMGVWALAVMVLGYVDLFNEFGLGTAIVHDPDRSSRPADVAFGMSIGIGLVFSVIGFMTAPLLAGLLGEPELTGVLRLLSVVYVLASFYQVHQGVLARELLFKERIGPEIARSATKAVVTIWLAVAGFGAYALVWGQIGATIVGAVAYWIVTPWRPRLIFDSRLAGSLLTYGSQIVLVGLLGQAAQNLDYVFISRELGTAAVGIYTVGFRLPELVVLTVPMVAGQVLVSAYVRLRDQPDELARALARTLRSVASVTLPLGVGLALVAPRLIEVLYGSRWADSAVLLEILAPATVLIALAFPVGDLLKAIGRPALLNMMVFGRLVVALVLLWWAARQSLEMVAVVQLCIAGLWLVLNLAVARVTARLPLGVALRSMVPALVSATAMVIAVFLLDRAWDPSPSVGLATTSLVGAAVYGTMLWMLDRTWVIEMRDRLLTRTR